MPQSVRVVGSVNKKALDKMRAVGCDFKVITKEEAAIVFTDLNDDDESLIYVSVKLNADVPSLVFWE